MMFVVEYDWWLGHWNTQQMGIHSNFDLSSFQIVQKDVLSAVQYAAEEYSFLRVLFKFGRGMGNILGFVEG